ncbi:glucose dehydrogenase [Candidatus Rickettsiella isopodorum]|jgi:quinoprotein glucose dehydrogenase|uniref:Glucose dehydrogenase n=1 Tax=Candidatus Rickettsiella isopodorum TaxID=1225476 RepID=A0A1J8NMZ8_9COXI|nr:pyrroloquinoline quinone-dependent dehydrogenase [Candidatus Rickettsiella isopodorum]OIZ96250.1 glucose dehydrogenase [Candidatus Rickettsiella isopodorum]
MSKLIKCIALFFTCFFTINVSAENTTWQTFNGDLKAQKYSPLTQITPRNVHDLSVAWTLHTGDFSTGKGKLPPTVWSATPLFVNNTIYVSTPFYRVFALNPATGKTKWIFDPHAVLKALSQPALKTRGVAYWQAETMIPGKACQKRIYIGTMDAKLYAIDANTGKPCTDFGVQGKLDINQWNNHPDLWPLGILQPPTVYKNLLILGWAGKDWTYSIDPVGNVFGLDARTGKLLWTFQSIPPDIAAKTGTSNVWASMSIDPDQGIVYLPISSPSPNFWGGNRLTPIPFGTSVTALNINNGNVIWSKQLVHHDLWDLDTNSAPSLVDIKKEGKTIPALVQTSKQGYLFILNRYTGEPIYPIVEKAVPASDAKGEIAASTQPTVPYPIPVVADKWPGVFKLSDWLSFGYCSRKLATLKYQGRFTPPSEQGSLIFPATAGGVEWGGGAVDPNKQIFVVNSSMAVQIYKLIPREDYNDFLKRHHTANVGEAYGMFTMAGSPYGFKLDTFLNPLGMPCWKPPYGEISAYALNTGQRLWKKPFGEVQQWGFYMPKSWGSITIGAPVITGSGLIFIGASMDSRVRALDLNTGDVLWSADVAAPAVSIPAIYEYQGKEYVVFVVGGNSILTPKVSDQVIAFALPSQSKS